MESPVFEKGYPSYEAVNRKSYVKPEEIVAGNQYRCDFVVADIPIDQWGRPGGMLSNADVPIARVGEYKSSGYIVARDVNTRLFEVQDYKTEKKFVVEFDNASNIELVE
jgi:hypothetical protein